MFFCGISRAGALIAGPGVYICDECVDLCNEILDEELLEANAATSQQASLRSSSKARTRSANLALNQISSREKSKAFRRTCYWSRGKSFIGCSLQPLQETELSRV